MPHLSVWCAWQPGRSFSVRVQDVVGRVWVFVFLRVASAAFEWSARAAVAWARSEATRKRACSSQPSIHTETLVLTPLSQHDLTRRQAGLSMHPSCRAALLALLAGAAAAAPIMQLTGPAAASSVGYSALCAVGRNENRYVREWVEYHKCLGACGGPAPRQLDPFCCLSLTAPINCTQASRASTSTTTTAARPCQPSSQSTSSRASSRT
jgi:hypothetical protein